MQFVVLYIFIVFVLSRFFVPYLGFGKSELPENIPASMQAKIDELKRQAKDKKDFLNLAYDFLGSKNYTGRIKVLLKFNYLFKDLENSWATDGYLPCTLNNLHLRIFLVKSKFFQDSEIKTKHTFLNFSIHQYLEIKLDNDWAKVDVGEMQRGRKIGEYVKGFSF